MTFLRSASILALAGAAASACAAEFYFSGYLTVAKQAHVAYADLNDPKYNLDVTGRTFWGLATSSGVTVYTSGPAWSDFSQIALPNGAYHADPAQNATYDLIRSLSATWGGGFVGHYQETYLRGDVYMGNTFLWGADYTEVTNVNVETDLLSFTRRGSNGGASFWSSFMQGVVTERYEIVGPNGPTATPGPAAALPFALIALKRRRKG